VHKTETANMLHNQYSQLTTGFKYKLTET